jgi:uncharacterized protein involved in tellurium resistance
VIGDPATAPRRADLPFLRHRGKARPTSSPVSDFFAGRGPRPHNPAPGTPAPQPPAPVPATAQPPAAAPAASSSLDLSGGPAPAQSRPIDFSRPPAPASTSSRDLSLDLSDEPAPAPAPVSASSSAAQPGLPVHRDTRVRAGEHHLLTITDPTVTLTRVQSGIGQLQIEAVVSPEIGDLRLGAAYQLRDGVSSTVQYAGGNRFAPSSRRPVIVAGRDEYEHLRIDLRQVHSLMRVGVYLFSESRRDLTWGGTLVVTTFGGARIELPLETLFAGRIAVPLSIYNMEGELVIRAEMETIAGDVREAARAYGYDRITWRDDRTPVG